MPFNKSRTAKAVGIGTAAALAMILILLCAECGVVMMLPSIPKVSLPYLAAAAIAVGTFAGGYIAAAIAGSRGLITGLLCGAGVTVCLLILGLCSGSFQPGAMTLIRAAVSLVFAALGGVKGINSKEKLHIR